MSKVTAYHPGTFCWPELVTADADRAKDFYAALFGWSYVDVPIGDGKVYIMAQLGGKNAGALFEMGDDMRSRGVPSHWGIYVSVADADASAARAEALGGALRMGPMDVPDAGRMVSLQDPTGAQLSLWQPRQHIGAQLMREHGALTWTELMTRDLETAERFYSGLFGWTADKESYAQMKYTVFMQGGQGVAGMMAITEDMGPIPPNWLVYFHVDSCDEAVEQAQAGGGALAAPVMDIADVGRIAIIRDPTGAVFGVMEPSRTGT